MRVANRVVLIACSASVIGAPTAAACSPQDYMSPEEWQALSPEQQAENSTGHTHETGSSAAPVAPVAPPADPPATRDAAPQVQPPAGNETAAARQVKPPPVRETAPVIPALDGPSHRRPAAERRAVTAQPSPPRAEKSPASPARNVTRETNGTSVAAARTTVVAVEQLTRLAAGSDAGQRGAAQRAERRTNERAAGRRQSARDRRATAAPAADARPDTQATDRVPVRADEMPATATRPDDNGRLTGLAAVLVALTGLAVLILRVFRPEASVQAMNTQVDPAAPAPTAAAADPVEAELQAIIAAQTATRLGQPPAGQDAGTGDESSTATNSA